MARKLFGIALIWVGLAALVYASTDPASPLVTLALGAGFVSFATGLLLFAEGFKGDLLREIRK
jgi:hypothetical protein